MSAIARRVVFVARSTKQYQKTAFAGDDGSRSEAGQGQSGASTVVISMTKHYRHMTTTSMPFHF